MVFPVVAVEEVPKEAIFNAHWLKNEAQSYLIRHSDYTILAGDTVAKESWQMTADVIVTDSMATSYTLCWRLHDYRIQTDHYLSKQWVSSLEDMRISYTTSQFGVLKDCSDAADFDKALDKSIDCFFSSYTGVTTEDSRERLYRLCDDWATVVLSGIYQMHQAYGLGYTLGEIVEVPAQVETRFSENPIDAVIYKKMESCVEGVATLVTSTVLDSAQMKQAIASYSLKEENLAQENLGALVMHLSTGWVLYSFDMKEVSEEKYLYGEMNEIIRKESY